jgi:hypothetical protein
MILISGPVIARLGLRTRKWAHDGIRRGWFGPVTRRRRVLFVSLQRVETFFEIQFTPAQIEQAREGQPNRVLIISEGNTNANDEAQISA